MKNVVSLHLAILSFLAGVISTVPAYAGASTSQNQPWRFPVRDRAGMAVVMKQVENGLYDRNRAGDGGAGVLVDNSQTNLLCGGGGSGSGGSSSAGSSATGNSSCVILNNTTGQLSLGQASEGRQSAGSTAASESSLSDTLGSISRK